MASNAVKNEETQFDEVYDQIVRLYDHAENILKLAYHESVTDHEQFLFEIDPLVKQIEESANQIAEDFSGLIERGEAPTNAMKVRVGAALRKVLLAIEEYRISAKNGSQEE